MKMMGCSHAFSYKGLEPGFPVLWEAVSAIDWPALCWLKGDFTFATAI
jgi:hypothetical protein